jgi:AcrR family transcriptional regulator
VRVRRGRRPGDPEETRAAILDAARSAFAETGYERATIRSIATRCEVDPALVHHHFGTKEDLFVAALDLPISPSALSAVLDDPGDGTTPGGRVARAYLTLALAGDARLEGLIRAAVSNDTARDMLHGFLERALLDTLAPRLDVDDARLRMALSATHLMGIVLARQIVGIGVLREATVDDLVAAIGPTIDRYLTGAAPVRAAPGPQPG